MRTLTFDAFEFDRSESEEGLEIAVATKGRHPFPDVSAFVSEVFGAEVASQLPAAVVFSEGAGPGRVRELLEQYGAVTLPMPCEWPVYVLSDEWNDWDAVLVGPSVFIRFHWWTTA